MLLLAPGGTGRAGSAGVMAAGTVVASDLVAPRYWAVTDDGAIYVSEAGNGGAEVLPAGPNANPSAPPTTRGTTGRVTKVARDGIKTAVAQGLPSYNADGPTGPNGIVYAGARSGC